MKYVKLKLSAADEDMVLADIKSLTWEGGLVYPNYPQDYEKSFNSLDRFIVTEPRQEVVIPAIFDKTGEETAPAVLGDWVSRLVLPAGYDTSHLKTLAND